MFKVLILSIFLVFVVGCGGDVESDAVDAIIETTKAPGIETAFNKCKEGDAARCTGLSDLSLGTTHFAAAISFAIRACDLKDAKGCLILGSLYSGSYPKYKDVEKSEESYRKACEIGDSSVCVKAAKYGIELGADKIESFVKKAFEKGRTENLLLGQLFDIIKLSKPVNQEKYYDELCSNDGNPACYDVAIRIKDLTLKDKYFIKYTKGKGNTIKSHIRVVNSYQSDRPKMLSYLNTLCDKGDKDMCYDVAKKFVSATDGKKPGFEIIDKACSLGEKEACLGIADYYIGMGRNKDIALKYFIKAAEAGDVKSFSIAVKGYLRRGMNDKADELANRCPLDAEGYFQIGRAYLHYKQKAKAKKYFDKACDIGGYRICNVIYTNTIGLWTKEDTETYRVRSLKR